MRIRSFKGAISYAAKYMGKLIDSDLAKLYGWDKPGRFWGILNKKGIPWGEALIVEVSTWFAHRLKRWLRKVSGYHYISHQGQTFYVSSPEAFFARLDALLALSP